MRRLLAALVVLAWPAALAAPAAASVEGPCSPTFNGVAVDRIDGLSSPLELDASDALVFSGSIEGGTTEIQEIVLEAKLIPRGST